MSDKRAEYRRKWVEALRSGNYKQTFAGRLRDGGSFCCLGVLCEITKDEIAGVWDGDSYAVDGTLSDIYVPARVMDLVGLCHDNGRFFDDAETCSALDSHSLAGLNDSGLPFEKIADLIEASPKNLFEEVTL